MISKKLLEALKNRYNLPEHELRQMAQLAAESDRREREALKLYQPLAWQARFHADPCHERVCLAANQDGKSLAGYVELVRAVTGQDPYHKYPERDGVAVIVGWDEKFLGLNPYRYLFKPGAFKVIRDEKTGKWRAYKPWTDEHRVDEAYPAPALLPKRYIEGVSWLKKKDHIFSKITLTTGWTILAFGSKGDPSPGFQADFVLIDEDIHNPAWYAEMVARLTIRKGRLVWAALPLNNNNEFQNLLDRFNEEEGTDATPTVKVFRPDGPNPYVDKETREANAKKWMASGEDVWRARALGEIATDHWLMYPGFDARRVHNCFRSDSDEEFFRILAKNNGMPPADWTRYIAFDPGWSVGCILFGATPPPGIGEFRVIYQEEYIRNCTAEKFGDAMERHCQNWNFEAFIIDSRGARLRELGSGRTPREQYEGELEKRGIQSNRTGAGFMDAVDHIEGRVLKLQSWLRVRPNGLPLVFVNEDACPALCQEMRRFRKKKDSVTGLPTDEGNRKTNTHAVECLEYLAAHGMTYHRPQDAFKPTPQDMWVDRIRRRQRMEASSGFRGIILGPSGS